MLWIARILFTTKNMALQPESRPETKQTPHPTQEGSIELTILTVLATTPARESDPAGNPEMQ
jgi:hypothetical protein